jgi:hypothetical protein
VSEQLVVTQDIPFNGGTVYAYRVGDSITREAVEANGWQDYVAGPATKKTAAAPNTSKES